MKIKKILNNSVIISADIKKREIIVMGKGIAFGLKNGDPVDESKIEKIFLLKNSEETSKFSQLLSEVPQEYFEFTEKIVDFAKERLGKKLHNSIYITLTDHINTMVERSKLHAYIKNTMLWEIRRLYKEEFEVAKIIIGIINTRFGSVYDDDEAASITLHLVNAELELDIDETVKITKIINEILNIVKYHFRIIYDEESLSYYRFTIHLRFFAQRIFQNAAYDDTDDSELVQHIQNKYKESFRCALHIKKFLSDLYHYTVTEEECMYLIIHIEKLVRESKKVKM